MTHRRRRANNFIMKTISITLRDDGTVYRDHDDKHIATIIDGNVISWKHHAFKNQHTSEVEALVDGDVKPLSQAIADNLIEPTDAEEESDDGFGSVIGGIISDSLTETPSELFREGAKAGWYGEENPPVVEWRRKNWGKAAFKAHYGHKTEALTEIYEQEGLTYNA